MGGIIVGVDGSDGSARALDWALEEGAAHCLPVKVIHAWSVWRDDATPADHDGDTRESAAARLAEQMLEDAQVRRGELPPVRATAVAIKGDPRVILTASAESSAANLVVVASRGATGPLARFFLGSTALYVSRRSPCPVTIVPADTRRLVPSE